MFVQRTDSPLIFERSETLIGEAVVRRVLILKNKPMKIKKADGSIVEVDDDYTPEEGEEIVDEDKEAEKEDEAAAMKTRKRP